MFRAAVMWLLLLLLSAAPAAAPNALRRRRSLLEGRSGSNGLGSWTATDEPMHKTVCGFPGQQPPQHPCRPGEGNLKGYRHWSQPYEYVDPKLKSRHPPHGVQGGHYSELIASAREAARGGFVALAAADFDYRELAENWWVAASRAGVPALVYAIDSDASAYLRSRGVTTVNGTSNLDDWLSTRLTRHIQRALAERQLAAAALAAAGFDVLLTDATHVFSRPGVLELLRAKPELDVLVPRGTCNPKKPVGCTPVWNFVFYRGSDAERRYLITSWAWAAINSGMVDFYLRWWAGHHCIFMGFEKTFNSGKPTLGGGLSAEAVAAQRGNEVASLSLQHRKFCPPTNPAACLRIGLLPAALVPPAGGYPEVNATALVGRSLRQFYGHRLRLDRYDEQDFDSLRNNMKADGLWML